MAKKKDPQSGSVDGGEGRGVRLGGRDIGKKPTGYAKVEPFDDDEVLSRSADPLDGYEDFAEADESAADRRRDPLRR